MPQFKSRKLKLTPLQREILVMLEEAGEENIPTVLTTLEIAFPQRSDAELLRVAAQAMLELWKLGLIGFGQDWGKPGLRAVPVALEDVPLPFNYWSPSSIDLADLRKFNVFLTAEGRRALRA